jgi:hypothetical protein
MRLNEFQARLVLFCSTSAKRPIEAVKQFGNDYSSSYIHEQMNFLYHMGILGRSQMRGKGMFKSWYKVIDPKIIEQAKEALIKTEVK